MSRSPTRKGKMLVRPGWHRLSRIVSPFRSRVRTTTPKTQGHDRRHGNPVFYPRMIKRLTLPFEIVYRFSRSLLCDRPSAVRDFAISRLLDARTVRFSAPAKCSSRRMHSDLTTLARSSYEAPPGHCPENIHELTCRSMGSVEGTLRTLRIKGKLFGGICYTTPEGP